ncbi:hypothetical protein E3O44_08035 [Cryobacterium algoricola]|uniref:Glycoside-hydrolase family GH114 TIM-barrel domain-containing protein n=1 Tax=Cryobacterium algoricola TaxID=1259183 RepID=A0ABY2IEM3_9MICO|nr:endo alpha-1,4 polygalactosaminidase [Cryobacterium algoricola]TFB87087.1 hypothetical protein E3O44_08035 [Cryobacterium algoricola]
MHPKLTIAPGIAVLAMVAALSGCSAVPPQPPATASAAGAAAGAARTPFPGGAQADYQLGGAYPVPAGTAVVTRDSGAEPAPGVYSICYVNGFQSQPGETADWLRDHPDLVLGGAADPVVDAGWPDEIIFDTSTDQRRAAIVAALRPTLQRCADAGFNAVEIDNLDSFTRSGGALTAADNIALVTLFAAETHALGLAIGQKNSAELAARLRTAVGFDFAVTEECDRFAECGVYTDAYGDDVLDIEYSDDLRDSFAEACARSDRPRSMVLRDRGLVADTDSGYVFEHCPS